MADCIFCAIVAGDAPAHKVAEDERTVAFLDIMPFTKGHTLVIPKVHTEDFWTIDVPTAQAMLDMALRVGGMVRENLGADGMNLLQNTGAAAWQTVFHAHLHVLPRWQGDGIAPPDILGGKMADPSVLADTAAQLRGEA